MVAVRCCSQVENVTHQERGHFRQRVCLLGSMSKSMSGMHTHWRVGGLIPLPHPQLPRPHPPICVELNPAPEHPVPGIVDQLIRVVGWGWSTNLCMSLGMKKALRELELHPACTVRGPSVTVSCAAQHRYAADLRPAKMCRPGNGEVQGVTSHRMCACEGPTVPPRGTVTTSSRVTRMRRIGGTCDGMSAS
jgi:hypothetical protein